MKKILFIFIAIMPVLAYGMRSRKEMRKELEEFSARLSASLRFIDGHPDFPGGDRRMLKRDRPLEIPSAVRKYSQEKADDFESRAAVARARNILVGFVAERLNSPAGVDVPGAAEEKAE